MMNRAAVTIPEKLFFKIGEVCDIVGIQAHVLRYWESEFPMLAPQKNRAGQRTYRKRDVEMVLRIKELLYEEQYTIPGARKRLVADIRGASKLKVVTPEMSAGANVAAPMTTDESSYSAPPTTAAPQTPIVTSPAVAAPAVTAPAVVPTASMNQSSFDANIRTESRGVLSDEERRAVRQLRAQLQDILAMLDDERR